MFHATHYLIANSGQKTEVCLEKSPEPGWYWVRSALDWFSGESIIQYHDQQGLQSRGVPLVGYSLETLPTGAIAPPPPPPAAVVIPTQSYSLRQMCKRFKCSDRLLRKMRESKEFTQWSKSRDPQGLTWEYRQEKYFLVDSVTD
ncbi:MAG TPA: hypothetical protein DDZ80_26520 [Cyanobacteria bacterium UBA8803]|nr:hypothetical protein [Cyanobacteria bacterium UBA8803]